MVFRIILRVEHFSNHSLFQHYRFLRLAANESIVRGQDYFSTLNNLAKNPWSTHMVWSYVK